MLYVSYSFAWEDFFENVCSPGTTTVSGYKSFSSGTKVHISCSFTSYIQSATDGGVIYFNSSSDESYLLVEKTTFFHIRSNGSGGSIYFRKQGHCILSMICALNSRTISNQYQFAFIVVSGKGYKNECYDCSITRTENPKYKYNLYQTKGTIVTRGVNMSRNRCDIYPGNSIGPTHSSSSTYTGFVSYSTFANCTAVTSGIVYWSWNDNPLVQEKITSVNIIDNNQNETSTTYGIISLHCKATIENSCITGNKGKYLFVQFNNFESILRNCTVDSYYSVSGKIPTVVNCPSTAFINIIPFINDAICEVVIALSKGKQMSCMISTCKPNKKRSPELSKLARFIFILNILPSSDIWFDNQFADDSILL